MSDKHEIKTLLGRVAGQAGAVDVLVNNAGLGDSVLFDRSDWTPTRQVLRTNTMAVAQLTSALVPRMWSAAAVECSTSDQARGSPLCQTPRPTSGAGIS